MGIKDKKSKISTFKKFFTFCDLLAPPFEFKPKAGLKNGTAVGGVITIIIGTFLLLYVSAQYYIKYTGFIKKSTFNYHILSLSLYI